MYPDNFGDLGVEDEVNVLCERNTLLSHINVQLVEPNAVPALFCPNAAPSPSDATLQAKRFAPPFRLSVLSDVVQLSLGDVSFAVDRAVAIGEQAKLAEIQSTYTEMTPSGDYRTACEVLDTHIFREGELVELATLELIDTEKGVDCVDKTYAMAHLHIVDEHRICFDANMPEVQPGDSIYVYNRKGMSGLPQVFSTAPGEPHGLYLQAANNDVLAQYLQRLYTPSKILYAHPEAISRAMSFAQPTDNITAVPNVCLPKDRVYLLCPEDFTLFMTRIQHSLSQALLTVSFDWSMTFACRDPSSQLCILLPH